jgi:hypothetical protein
MEKKLKYQKFIEKMSLQQFIVTNIIVQAMAVRTHHSGTSAFRTNVIRTNVAAELSIISPFFLNA